MTALACPDCGRRFSVSRAQAGRTARCAACGATVAVPDAPDSQAGASDASDDASDEISRVVGDRPRGIPAPSPPARPRAVRVLLVIGLILGLLALTAALFVSVVL